MQTRKSRPCICMLVSDVLTCVPGGVCSVSRQCREIIAILDTWGSRFIQVQTHHTYIEAHVKFGGL